MTKIKYIIISFVIISLGYFAYEIYSLQKQIKEVKTQHENAILVIGNFLDQATQGQLSAYVKQLQKQ